MADLVALMDQLWHAASPVVGPTAAYRGAPDHPDLVRAPRDPRRGCPGRSRRSRGRQGSTTTRSAQELAWPTRGDRTHCLARGRWMRTRTWQLHNQPSAATPSVTVVSFSGRRSTVGPKCDICDGCTSSEASSGVKADAAQAVQNHSGALQTPPRRHLRRAPRCPPGREDVSIKARFLTKPHERRGDMPVTGSEKPSGPQRTFVTEPSIRTAATGSSGKGGHSDIATILSAGWSAHRAC
jgi:hypothetical protein